MQQPENQHGSIDPGRGAVTSLQHRLHDLSGLQAGLALVVVDMQNLFVETGQPLAIPRALAIVPTINGLVSAVRACSGAIIWTRHTFDPAYAPPPWFEALVGPEATAALQLLRPGSRPHEIFGALRRQPEDLVIDKHRMSAFVSRDSNLDAVLRVRGIDTLIVAGTVTNFCCQGTARDAMMRDYRVLFTTDGTAARNDEDQQATLVDLQRMGFFDLRTASALSDELRQSPREVPASPAATGRLSARPAIDAN